MRRFVVAFVLAIGWMVSPWLVGAEEQPAVERMYAAMEWCLPADRMPEPVTIRENGTESMYVTVGTQEMVLLTAPSSLYIHIVNVRHPDAPTLRIGFPMPTATDTTEQVEAKKVFALMASGCFVLSQPPR